MKELTYADIRKMALEHGIKDTKLHIGLWATDRYVKKRKMALEHGIKDTRLHIGLWASDQYIKKRKMIQGKMYMVYLPYHKPEQE